MHFLPKPRRPEDLGTHGQMSCPSREFGHTYTVNNKPLEYAKSTTRVMGREGGGARHHMSSI